MRILVTGASGFLGQSLVEALARQRHEVLRLTRSAVPAADTRLFQWDPAQGQLDSRALEGVEAVIHLAGEPIAAGRWDPATKQRLRDSRVASTRLLLDRIEATGHRPRVFLAASAIGIYGDRGDELVDEASPPGNDFLAGVCRDWEAETARAAALGMRLAQLRIGLVLSPQGGLLKRLKLPFQLGLGGKLGNGRQWMSWIALPDLLKAFFFVLLRDDLSGVFNLTAPNPVTNAQFSQSLGRALNRPARLPMPAFAIKLALGEMGETLLLGGQKVQPRHLREAGFEWESPFVGEALNRLFHRKP